MVRDAERRGWSRSSRCTSAGTSASRPRFGRKFRGLKVTQAETADYCERVLRGYLERREPGERFAAYAPGPTRSGC